MLRILTQVINAVVSPCRHTSHFYSVSTIIVRVYRISSSASANKCCFCNRADARLEVEKYEQPTATTTKKNANNNNENVIKYCMRSVACIATHWLWYTLSWHYLRRQIVHEFHSPYIHIYTVFVMLGIICYFSTPSTFNKMKCLFTFHLFKRILSDFEMIDRSIDISGAANNA